MEKKNEIIDYCKRFKLSGIKTGFDDVLGAAQEKQMGYLEYTLHLFSLEAVHRQEKDLVRRKRFAQLPPDHSLDNYDYSFENGVSKSKLNQLRELDWIDKIFNIILMGPSGSGKTYIAAGLCNDAIKAGYHAYFRTMEQLVNVLKMKDITGTAAAEYKRLLKANLIVIDDIMMFPIEKNTAISFFNFINEMFEKSSFIITTNKAPVQWAEILDDEVLVTAILDRLLN
jgi:DNA replication protein DnaC